jgi:hypothetical protein
MLFAISRAVKDLSLRVHLAWRRAIQKRDGQDPGERRENGDAHPIGDAVAGLRADAAIVPRKRQRGLKINAICHDKLSKIDFPKEIQPRTAE